MITINQLENFQATNNLEKEVLEYAIHHTKQYVDNSFESYVNDLMNHGCESGMIGDLVYYEDTVAFYNEHKEDINDLLSEIVDWSFTPKEIFSDWNNHDALALKYHNQNILAWFGFEQATRKIANELGMDV